MGYKRNFCNGEIVLERERDLFIRERDVCIREMSVL